MRAVVADDDRGTATIVTNLLKQASLEVAVAHDGNAAWELLTAAPAPALAIIDWMMPGVDGLELCRRIKREPSLAKTHVILLTAKNDQQDGVARSGRYRRAIGDLVQAADDATKREAEDSVQRTSTPGTDHDGKKPPASRNVD